jgi:short-subunit dehydrogenase
MTVASSLSGRHALVCGASAGIGRASAFALAKRGASLTLLARRADRLQALIPDLIAAGAASATAAQCTFYCTTPADRPGALCSKPI